MADVIPIRRPVVKPAKHRRVTLSDDQVFTLDQVGMKLTGEALISRDAGEKAELMDWAAELRGIVIQWHLSDGVEVAK